jgi:hypothetical protein
VARHGPMVLSVCRCVLRDPNDAEDASALGAGLTTPPGRLRAGRGSHDPAPKSMTDRSPSFGISLASTNTFEAGVCGKRGRPVGRIPRRGRETRAERWVAPPPGGVGREPRTARSFGAGSGDPRRTELRRGRETAPNGDEKRRAPIKSPVCRRRLNRRLPPPLARKYWPFGPGSGLISDKALA